MIAAPTAVKGLAVPHFFLDLRQEKRTGTAVFEGDAALKKVYVKDGEITFASSNLYDDRLGECLLRAGKITQQEFDASTEIMKRSGKMQGAVLIETGALRPQDLVAGVQFQVKEIIRGLFGWRGARFWFDEGPLPLREIIPLRMSTGNVILEGLRGLEWQTVRKLLPNLRTVVAPVSDPFILFQSVDLTQDQRAVLDLVDGKRSIEELCALSGLGDYNTLTAVFLLLGLRMCEAGEVKSEKEAAAAVDALRQPASSGPSPAAGADEQEPADLRPVIKRAFEDLEGTNHYHMLDVSESATAAEIKKAYFRLAKRYHPDRHYDPDMADLKPMLEALFSRLTQAYNTLSNQAKREEYDLARLKADRKIEEEKEPAEDRTATAENQFANGMREYKGGNFWGAAEAFRWAARLDPNNARYYYYYGMALSQMPRRHHDAEESLRKAIELDPAKVRYYLGLGALLVRNNLKARALALYREALTWDPDSEQIKQAMDEAGGAEQKDKNGGALKKPLTKK
jgi:tetratricopeptide (TPR) repeat protein